jgi:hypothetical protein
MTDIVIPQGYSREDLIACAERELRLREQVYPRQVEARKMTLEQSSREMGRMRAIIAVLRQLPVTQGSLELGGRAR